MSVRGPRRGPGSRYRAAVVGLGKIAQVKYLPQLARHPRFELVGLCDHAASLGAALGALYGVPSSGRFEKLDDLLGSAAPDVLLVLTHDHFEPVSQALAHRVATLVEKPVTWSASSARELLDSARTQATPLFPAYMRLFDPLLHRLRSTIDAKGPPLSVRCRNLGGGVKRWTDPLQALVKPGAEEKSEESERLAVAWRSFFETRGLDPLDPRCDAYRALLQLGIHDLSLLAALFGPLCDVTSAQCRSTHAPDGAAVVVHAELSLREGVPCSFELAPLMGSPWPWLEQIELVYPDELWSYELGNPFLPTSGSRLRCGRLAHGMWREESTVESLVDPFALQLDALAGALDGEPRAFAADPVADLEIVEWTLERMTVVDRNQTRQRRPT